MDFESGDESEGVGEGEGEGGGGGGGEEEECCGRPEPMPTTLFSRKGQAIRIVLCLVVSFFKLSLLRMHMDSRFILLLFFIIIPNL